MTPKRIQRKRTKGWKMPENTVYVGRPTKWGNPWTLRAAIDSKLFKPEHCPQIVVTEYEQWLRGMWSDNDEHLGIWKRLEKQRAAILSSLPELRGKDLACWCPLDQPCHADVLLRLANEQKAEINDQMPARNMPERSQARREVLLTRLQS